MFSIISISFIPIVFWVLAKWPIATHFSDTYSIFLSLGQITGIVGLTLFSMNLVISARLSILENLFKGLNQAYKKHHQIGGIAFILLMVHPLMMIFSRYSISLKYTMDLIVPGSDFFVDLGIIALLLLMTLLLLTFYRNLPYQIWRLTHQLTGVVFIIAVIHSFLMPSTISGNKPLFWVMIILVSIGIVSYLYRTVFFRFLVKRHKYKVLETVKLNNKVVMITLVPEGDKKMNYHAGQFVFVSFDSNSVPKEIHPFSIASSDSDKIVILSKDEGDYTKKLIDIEASSIALVEGPFGRFSNYYYNNPRQIWIAGGIGIAPFVGMAESIDSKSTNVDLYCCYHDETEKLGLRMKNIFVKLFYSKTMGHITAEYIKENSKDFEIADFFICGPTSMMNNLRKQLVRLGVRNSRIHTEEFDLD